MHRLVTYLFAIPFPVVRGRWRVVFRGLRVVVFHAFLVFPFVPLLFFCFPFLFFFGAHTSRLAPMARTLLGVLGHATLNFFVVATRLFLVFCVCPKFCDLAKQRRKVFWGVSEVRKNDFPVYFCWLCVFLLVFLFFSCPTGGLRTKRVRYLNRSYRTENYQLVL